eukprot:TRINITY_DN111528_c0_g1_i1.p1 TRINITY_DN111528_c0_g1~~TRINITY_DN111528_c0_g1_i1.p1  ORF type:complete len:422 (+),score=168.27 TRINITY_DN111528_c0_g1_i1:120-1385(+)
MQFEVDPEQEKELDAEFGSIIDEHGWEDLMDGKIKKKTLVKGSHTHRPDMQQDVLCTVRLYSTDAPPKDDEIRQENLLQTWENKRFRIGESEAPPVLELCLRHMFEKDECDAYATNNMAFGPRGFKKADAKEKDIPPNTDLRLHVTLHKIFPKTADREPTWSEKLEQAMWRKAAGNDYYKRQEMDKAMRCYKTGLGVAMSGRCTGCGEMGCTGYCLDTSKPEGGWELRKKEGAQMEQLLVDCGSNMSMVSLEQGNYLEAREAASAVLEERPEHLKALYRLAKAQLLLHEFDECEALLKKAQEVDAEDVSVKKLWLELRKEKQNYAKKSKELAGKFFKPDPKAAETEERGVEKADAGVSAKSPCNAEDDEPEEDKELRRLLEPPPEAASSWLKNPVWLLALVLPVALAVGYPLLQEQAAATA